jgi:alpha-D-ribose 1-methylphosphonate 5-triphosphate synthase subunit PhnH
MNAIPMEQATARLGAGLADPVHDAQRAFRAALAALARPGRPVDVGQAGTDLPLEAAMAHLLLALADDDSTVWWQDDGAPLAHWLRFHTGARLAADPRDAMFAVVTNAMPGLDGFAQGTAASPELSCTLLVAVPSLLDGPALQWRGPGIRDAATVSITGLPASFWSQWQANHAGFPQGVDVLFTCGAQLLGLPRTTRVSRVEGV